MTPYQERLILFLRWTERFTRTDMVYLAKSGLWTNLASLAITLMSFVLYVAFAHFLPKEIYGTYQYLLSVAAIIGTFTLTGVNTAIVQSVARGHEGTLRASIRPQLLWALIPSAASIIGAGYYTLHGNMLLAGGFLLIGIFTPLTSTFNSYSSYLLGKKDFRRVFLYNLSLNLPYYVGLIIASYFFKSAIVLLGVNLAINGIGLFVLYRFTLHTQNPNNDVDESALTYGKHLSLMGVFSAIAGQIDNVLVFHFLGPIDLAVYTFATAIPDRAANFLKFFSSSALPKFSEKTDREVVSTLGPKLLKLTALAFVGFLIYIVAAPLFFRIFFPQYADSVPYSALYALSMVGIAGGVALSALIGLRRTKDLYVYNIVSPILQLILQVCGILLYGLWGLVLAKTISVLASSTMLALLALRRPKEEARA